MDNQKNEAEIKDRVKIIDWKKDAPIIILEEFEKQTVATSKLLWDEVEHLANGKPFYVIVDLSNSEIPDAELRAYLAKRYEKLKNSILFIYAYVGKKIIFKTMLKFLAASARYNNYDVINSVQHGLEKINKRNDI